MVLKIDGRLEIFSSSCASEMHFQLEFIIPFPDVAPWGLGNLRNGETRKPCFLPWNNLTLLAATCRIHFYFSFYFHRMLSQKNLTWTFFYMHANTTVFKQTCSCSYKLTNLIVNFELQKRFWRNDFLMFLFTHIRIPKHKSKKIKN